MKGATKTLGCPGGGRSSPARRSTRAGTPGAEQTEGRFQTFAEYVVRGLRRLPEGLVVYRHLLEAVTDASDGELIEGLDSTEILIRGNPCPRVRGRAGSSGF